MEVTADALPSRIDDPFMARQSDEWIAEFYAFLDTQHALWRPKTENGSQGPLRSRPFIRTEAGTHTPPFRHDGGPAVYLPSAALGTPERTVRRSVAADERASAFLRKLGVSERDTTDEVIETVLPKFSGFHLEDAVGRYAKFLEEYEANIVAICSAVESCPRHRAPHLRERLIETPFVLAFNMGLDADFGLKRLSEVVSPTQDLMVWFAGDADAWFVSQDLAESAEWEAILDFVGNGKPAVRSELRPTFRPPTSEGHVVIESDWGRHVRGLRRFDPRAKLPGLDRAVDSMNAERARILWRVLLDHPFLVRGTVQTATKQNYVGAVEEERLSPLGTLCTDREWVPRRDGGLCRPSAVSLEDLPEGFEASGPAAEALAAALGMLDTGARDIVKKLGITQEDVALIQRNREDFERWKSDQAARAARASFPDTAVPNPQRLERIVADEAIAAVEIEYERRERSVRVTQGRVPEEPRAYLIARYTDADGSLRCQACREPMPFALDDGSPYFECVGFLRVVRRELYQNHLALCPVCAAKFRHARRGSEEHLYAAFMALTDAEVELPVVLAQRSECLRFNSRHKTELLAAVRALLSS